MPSDRQLAANRRNGLKGGPKTEAGKQASRQNAIKHGLTSTTLVVLAEEREHEYQELLQGFRDSFQPQDAAEEALVLRLAQSHWRSLRSRRVETGILTITAATERGRARKIVADCRTEDLNPHNAIAVGFMISPAEQWQMYLRYDTTISREFFRTLDALTRLQKVRQKNKPPEPVLVTRAGASQATRMEANDFHVTPEMSDSGIRSVSQNGPAAVSGSNDLPENTPPRAITMARQPETKDSSCNKSMSVAYAPEVRNNSIALQQASHPRLGQQADIRGSGDELTRVSILSTVCYTLPHV